MIAATVEMIGLATIPAILLLDLVVRNKKYDAVRHWRLLGLAVSAAAFALSIPVAMFWANLIGDRSLLDLSGLGTWAGAAVGFLVYQLVHYWYHRLAHESDFLWKLSHQMHHSAESMDAFGAYYLHPMDVFFFTTWASLVFFPLLGLAPAAGAVAAAGLTACAMFQHANIRTPRWVGYIIQRPESHSVHHGRHRHNYSDLPLMDMIFGTFENPAEAMDRAGFYKGASRRIWEMLIFRDVSTPKGPAREEIMDPTLEKVA